VRAHLRLERTRDLPLGGPIVEPSLVADPLLLAGLAGIVVAWLKRREMGAALLAAASIPFITLAFVPFVAPLFGKIVLPWMAYRALWLIPFGSLLAILLAALPRNATGTLLRGITALALLALTLAALPWNRASARPDVFSPLRDRDTREVLARIAALPVGSRIAAAPGFAELIPALAGRPVVAVADRGTFVFAGSHVAAEERLRASAVLVGLAPGSPRVRRAGASRGGATHFVTHGRACGRVGHELFRSGPLRLCEVRQASSDTRFAELLAPSTTGERNHDHDSAVRAAIGAGIACDPVVERDGDVYRWRRESRWTAKPVAIRCRAKLEPPATADLALILAAELPRARETMILRAVLRTTDGRKLVHHAAATLAEGVTADVALPGTGVRAVRLRLTPAYLPYLNLRELFLREQRDVGE
jgi:branched-subunit amino acid transport protein